MEGNRQNKFHRVVSSILGNPVYLSNFSDRVLKGIIVNQTRHFLNGMLI